MLFVFLQEVITRLLLYDYKTDTLFKKKAEFGCKLLLGLKLLFALRFALQHLLQIVRLP